MIINHPLLGPRDSSEFVYLGDAALINRPAWQGQDADSQQIAISIAQFHDYLHLRDNIAGEHRELWYHYHGDRSWLVITRNTVSHAIIRVELATDVARARQSAQQ